MNYTLYQLLRLMLAICLEPCDTGIPIKEKLNEKNCVGLEGAIHRW